MTDTVRLKQIIRDKGLIKKRIAEIMGLSTNGLAMKIDGKSEFKGNEIVTLCEILGISDPADVCDIFFSTK